jgi:glycolate oxidase iron-sulfur subunit
MQTRFTAQQLERPIVAASEPILRKCVHCGFCTATCPTYVLLGDELDSPRGRIYLIKDMLENDRPATADVVRHVDRCLSCLACMTTCPSGVHYQHLIDHARVHVEQTFRRPFGERMLRAALAAVLPYPGRVRLALVASALARPFERWLPAPLRGMLELASRGGARLQGVVESPFEDYEGASARTAAATTRRMRVALVTGCVQTVIAPEINAATVRLLDRCGAEVVAVGGCCGALVHHLGLQHGANALAAALVERLHAELDGAGLDAIVANASGCGTHVKDYGYVFRDDARLAARAAAVSAKARDVTEVLVELGLPRLTPGAAKPRVAYHSACSMQHGQKVERPPRDLLAAAGFPLAEIAEGHLCCGSAGTYNILQPELAGRLRERKLENIARTRADVVATGNVGCIAQLAARGAVPVVHTVELLDWATGGPRPPALASSNEPAASNASSSNGGRS